MFECSLLGGSTERRRHTLSPNGITVPVLFPLKSTACKMHVSLSILIASAGIVLAEVSSNHAVLLSSSEILQHEILLTEYVKQSLSSRGTPEINPEDILVPNRGIEDVENAMEDFSHNSLQAWKFLKGLAQSESFRQEFWQRHPFLIRAKDTGGWVAECFTIERDLKLIDGSYITGFKTAEVLRNGTKTDTWALSPLKENQAQRTQWCDVEEALKGGTIYFNTAGSLWKNLGGLCRLVGYAFGLPPNVNVYCTPPSCELSVPLHTDKQDVFVFQSQGSKRWRVYAPPPRAKGKDPLSRGKAGDVLSFNELGEPLIDTVIQPGDVLYLPTGFPHATDTVTSSIDGVDIPLSGDPSVHLTMGLDTHVWFLALAHLRWSLLQRCNTSFNADLEDDAVYWKAMGSIPFGFLGGSAWKATVASINNGEGVEKNFVDLLSEQLTEILIKMEPSRWTNASEKGKEPLPSKKEIDETVAFFVTKHWKVLMETQEELYRDVDSRNEESLLKAFRGTQEQNQIMEDFGWFSNNKAFAESFRSRRLMNEQRAQMAMQQ